MRFAKILLVRKLRKWNELQIALSICLTVSTETKELLDLWADLNY